MIRTIFVPLDISKSDEVVIKYAIELAKHFNSHLLFLKTFLSAEYAYPTTGMASFPASDKTIAMEGKEIHKEKLAYLQDEFPKLDAVDFELKVLSGPHLEVISAVIHDAGVDLILIGTSGAAGIKELLGTIAEKVTREASCPVMVIPDEFQFAQPRKLSLALDVDNLKNRLHLDTMFYIANSFSSSIDVVNVSDDIDKADIHHNIIFNRIKNEFDENVKYFNIRILLNEDEEKALEEYIERNNIDLLTIVYREHGFFKRLFDPGLRKKLVFHSHIPILVLK